MAHYIDGFAHAIPRAELDSYTRMAEAVAEIWKEHGAIEYREYINDDVHLPGTQSFKDLIRASDGNAILFGWVVFESREARDLANEKVAADSRMPDLIRLANTSFDAKKMAYGGFRSLINSTNS